MDPIPKEMKEELSPWSPGLKQDDVPLQGLTEDLL